MDKQYATKTTNTQRSWHEHPRMYTSLLRNSSRSPNQRDFQIPWNGLMSKHWQQINSKECDNL